MKKPVGMTILAFGTLLVASCTAQRPQNQTSSIQSEVTTPGPTKKLSPIATAAINADGRLPGGQGIPSTDPEVRIKQVEAGGRDPFAPVQVSPIIMEKQPIITEKLPLPPTYRVKIAPQPNNGPHQIAIALTTDPGPVEAPEVPRAILPKIQPLPPIQTARLPILTTPSMPSGRTAKTRKASPLPPEARSAVTALGTGSPGTSRTEIAEAVKVSGVIELGSGKKAIVQVPGSKTQRYVAEGEWLGQGKVQVKRIELDEMGDPVVILSENGREVVKMVGSTSNTIAGSFGWTN